MPIQSYAYALFVAGALVVFYLLPRRARPIFLLVASGYFYWTWNAWYLIALAGLATSDWAIGLALERRAPGERRMLLAAGVGANLLLLATFKYLNFATGTIAALAGLHASPFVSRLFVPIGISFHTFQSISYLVDVSRGRLAARRRLLDYALYLAFFPQLLAGPIVRAERFFAELDEWTRPAAADVIAGAREIVQGLVKKSVLADTFGAAADTYFGAISAHPGALAAWGGALAFAWEIYFDFSGYSDIAIGTARLFGFAFPQNFLRPYLAPNITDFWRRWHVSLSSWLRDYLYIPLGGSRHGSRATTRNLMLTMLLGGLWHGANWTFVAWGGYHGALLACARFRRERAQASRSLRPAIASRLAGTLATFTLVTLGWVLFRAPTFADAATVFVALVTPVASEPILDRWAIVLAAVAFGCEAVAASGRLPAFAKLGPLMQGGTIALLLLILEFCAAGGSTPRTFVYFKF